MTASTHLHLDHTWDGQPLPARERARVTLAHEPQSLHIEVDAPFWGDPPPTAPVGSTEGLWEHEVIEVFLAAQAQGELPRYTEIELSPHGHWLVLRFAGVRRRVAAHLPLELRAEVRAARWHGAAILPASCLPSPPWRVNAFGIHGPAGARRYCAASPLPGPAPDFHQPHRFPRLFPAGNV